MIGQISAQQVKEKLEAHQALFWKKEKDLVRCNACQRHCAIPEGKTGFCRVRRNVKGKLVALSYGRTMGLPVDPIEKKPLFHFKPASAVTSISTYGCNFACLYCQNYLFAQEWTHALLEKVPFTSPKEIVDFSLRNGAQGISYTYTEPTVFVEYALDTMKLAREAGLYNVWVSNGYMSEEVLSAIQPYLDGINIDLKGDARFYREVCGNVDIAKVKEAIEWCYKHKIHLEVTNLIIPGYNDSKKSFEEVAGFVASLSKDVPLHFSRFFPAYKMRDVPPTDVKVLKKAREAALKAGLRHVYLGNVSQEGNTFCHQCKNLLVKRSGYLSEAVGLKGNKCAECGAEIYLVP